MEITANKIILFYFIIADQLAATLTCSTTVVYVVFFKVLVYLLGFCTVQRLFDFSTGTHSL